MDAWYYGLADCRGIESFVHDVDEAIASMFLEDGETERIKSNQFALAMRAMANPQRFAVVYRVLLPVEVAREVEKDLENGKYMEALNRVKKGAKVVELGTYATTKSAAEKRWKMIPNPDLDPTA